jgi:hypothetical protein
MKSRTRDRESRRKSGVPRIGRTSYQRMSRAPTLGPFARVGCFPDRTHPEASECTDEATADASTPPDSVP